MPLYELDGNRPDLAGSGEPNDLCWVAPCATLIGKVVLHEDASVWFGAVLRGDNESIVIGEGSNVQELTSMHTDMGYPLVVGKYCTIGRSYGDYSRLHHWRQQFDWHGSHGNERRSGGEKLPDWGRGAYSGRQNYSRWLDGFRRSGKGCAGAG